ncbi:dehydrogenase [Hyaloraphidium curvatum]|nr:dehydrogenase [Hyaloraphidium curvatum]
MPDFGFDTTAEEAARAYTAQIRGKNVLITGASPNSLGAECARVCAKEGANLVVLAGRNRKNLEDTAEAIRKDTPGAQLRLLDLDLQNFEQVRQAAKEVLGYKENINVLFNNAGIMAVPYRIAAKGKGLESQIAGNHFGHFEFTMLIMPKLLAASTPAFKSRIINVSSAGHQLGPVRFDDLNFGDGKKYKAWTAYGQSKTANILFSRELAKRYGDKILSFSLHPGGITTNLARDVEGEALEFLMKTRQRGGKRKLIPNGTSTHIVAGFDPEIADRNGAYLVDCKIAEEQCAPHAKDMAAAERLWKLSEEVLRDELQAKL